MRGKTDREKAVLEGQPGGHRNSEPRVKRMLARKKLRNRPGGGVREEAAEEENMKQTESEGVALKGQTREKETEKEN